MSKILVTGGMGFIGSHTVVELLDRGFDVVIIDDLSNSNISVLNNIKEITGKLPEFCQFDLCNREKLSNFFDSHSDIDAIIHFAAYKAVGESVGKSLDYYRNNLNSLMNILFEMRKHGVKHIVFSSSCTVYGQPDVLPVTENAPIKPAESPYGNTKRICEEILRDAVVSYDNLDVIALRYFNPIGAHKSALIGELPNGVPNNLIPYITQTAIGIRECLSIFGNDYNTPDGSCIRDFIDVVDLAKAHNVAIERLLNAKNKARFETFNIGTGRGVSVIELVSKFEQVTGVKLNHKIVGRRAGDIEQIWADPTYANTELGWKAEIPIEETLLSAWNWQKHITK